MSTTHEKPDAAEEEKEIAVSNDGCDQVSHAEGVGRDYELKCNLSNKCFQEEIRFGRYQWQLFILTGLGWLADSEMKVARAYVTCLWSLDMWFQGLAVALPQVQQELNPVRVEYAVLAEFAGLIVGATTWGILADVIGRRLSFNITLFLAGLFGLAAGGAPNFVIFSSLVACMGFGLGGNLPVDGALYLEHIPQSHQWTLTLLSVWWALGQLVSSLIGWVFIANFSCDASIPNGLCPKSDNMGWRYILFTLGALTFSIFICRFFVFDVQESSKFLIAQGRDEEAIKVLEHIARRNGVSITLTLKDLQAVSGDTTSKPAPKLSTSVWNAFSTLSLLIGIAYPLFNAYLPLYLDGQGTATGSSSLNEAYRNYSIISILGIPGSLIACAVVDYTRGTGRWLIGGRKLSLAVSTMLTGFFLFLFTTSKTTAAVLGYSCASGLTQNAVRVIYIELGVVVLILLQMYGVLYAYTPEVFPAPHRGTGDALCAALNRIGGFIAPLIKIATTPLSGSASTTSANSPVFVSASLFMVAALLTMLLPIETAGKMAL
ncbi:MFS general substrate transporter [Rhizopogon salebrosus TDB-379]|nr:MFS general substrate transporter [Rhizopogon salebrosus TDB-379]